jgi:hypothetical protein
MMFRFIQLLVLGALLSLTTSCGLVARAFRSKPKPQTATDGSKEMFIGVVDLVNPEQHFVLVRTVVNLALRSGTSLEIRSPEGNKSSATVTPEHKSNYISADIASGMPKRGDAVILVAPDKPGEGATPETPINPAKPFNPAEAEAQILGQNSPAAIDVPGTAPSDAEMIPGVAPKGVAPAADKPTQPAGQKAASKPSSSGGDALPPVIH